MNEESFEMVSKEERNMICFFKMPNEFTLKKKIIWWGARNFKWKTCREGIFDNWVLCQEHFSRQKSIIHYQLRPNHQRPRGNITKSMKHLQFSWCIVMKQISMLRYFENVSVSSRSFSTTQIEFHFIFKLENLIFS